MNIIDPVPRLCYCQLLRTKVMEYTFIKLDLITFEKNI